MGALTRQLDELIPEWVDTALSGIRVSGVCQDSRELKAGDLFLARSGLKFRGVDFIPQAIQAGVAVILLDEAECIDLPPVDVPVIPVPGLAGKMSLIAARFYGEPSKTLCMVGVTGTNGKTSCAHFLAQAMNKLGKRTAVIGTIGNGFPGELETATHTTPDAVGLQTLLHHLQNEGAEAVVMEVSSHALDQGRVDAVHFDYGLFTNLTRDHLDYHGSMDAYAEAKARLFRHFDLDAAILNVDDPYLAQLKSDDSIRGKVFAVARSQGEHCFAAYRLGVRGIEAEIRNPHGPICFTSPIVGEFNLDNLLLVSTTLQAQGYTAAEVAGALSAIKAVPGRMEMVLVPGKPVVVVDYAHTPDALEKALQSLRSHAQGKLWCLFGCGGDRDQGKRAEMGAIADRLADHVLLTNDNPRSEAPEQIIKMIETGVVKHRVLIERDRERAIALAISQAEENDLILVAGKGHEDYQEIDGVRYPFSDVEVCHRIMGVAA